MQVRVDHSEHVDLHVVKDLQGHVQLHPDTFGGWTPVQKATPEIQHIADQVGIHAYFYNPQTASVHGATSCRLKGNTRQGPK